MGGDNVEHCGGGRVAVKPLLQGTGSGKSRICFLIKVESLYPHRCEKEK
jgi:hypothetical protein